MDDENDDGMEYQEPNVERKAIIWTPDTTDLINNMLEDKWDIVICAPSSQQHATFCLLERKLPDD